MAKGSMKLAKEAKKPKKDAKKPATAARLGSIGLIIAGIIGLKLAS